MFVFFQCWYYDIVMFENLVKMFVIFGYDDLKLYFCYKNMWVVLFKNYKKIYLRLFDLYRDFVYIILFQLVFVEYCICCQVCYKYLSIEYYVIYDFFYK